MRTASVFGLVVVLGSLAGCAADAGPEEETAAGVLGAKGDHGGDEYCDLATVSMHSQLTTLNLTANVCHHGSTPIEVGAGPARGTLTHPELRPSGGMFGGVTTGCNLWDGDVSIPQPVAVEAHAFRIPLGSPVGVDAVYADVGEGSGVAIDVLTAQRVADGVTVMAFEPRGHAVELEGLGEGSPYVHDGYGERNVVLRIRPGTICPGQDHVDYELRVGGSPSSLGPYDDR